MIYDEKMEIEKTIEKYRGLTSDISDLTAMDALDLKKDFAFIDLLALADKDDIPATANALLFATKLGYRAGQRAESLANYYRGE